MKKIIIIIVAIGAVVAALRTKNSPEETPLPTKEAPTPMAVYAVDVKTGPIREFLYGMGTARAVKREFLVFETSGKVTHIANGTEDEILRPGDAVKAGQLLAQLDDSDQIATVKSAEAGVNDAQQQQKVAKASLEQAKARLELATKRLAREKDLLAGGAASTEAVEQATTEQIEASLAAKVATAQHEATAAGIDAAQAKLSQARTDVERCKIISPIDGIIAHMNLRVGWQFSSQTVRTDSEQNALRTTPFVVVDSSQFDIILDLPDYQLPRLKRNQSAWVGLSRQASEKALGDAGETPRVMATVHAVSPGIATGGRSVRVTLRTTPKNPGLHDGQHVWGAVLVSEKTDALTVPLSAILVEDRRNFAFLVADGIAHKREIQIGLQGDRAQEISSGLASGDKVITEGKFNVYDGMPVRILTEEADAR